MGLTVAGAASIIAAIRKEMDKNRDHLIELDSAMGDGDLGLTMTKAFVAADELLATESFEDPGIALVKAGMAMAKAAPSTMGTLVATGFMRGGKAISGRPEVGPDEIAVFFRAFVDGVMQRGKSKPGEKTVVDVFDPVATALEGANAPSVAESAAIMRSATEKALEAVKDMISQHGKAAIYREQTKGKPDPGAVAGSLIIFGFAQTLEAP